MLSDRISIRSIIITALLIALAGCAEPDEPEELRQVRNDKTEQGSETASSGKLGVVSESGKALPGAQVLIGPREGVPFAGNFMTADASGQIAIPAEWTDLQPVTVAAEGHVRVTYLAQAPGARVFRLRATPASGRVELTGKTDGFGSLQRDGFLDVGLVFPAIPKNEVLGFQIASVISSETDQISVIGNKMHLPSNLTLPRQTESYILPITFDKPRYRLYFGAEGAHRVVATHARFPMKKVVDEMRGGKKVFDIINHFQFRGAGVSDVALSGASTKIDFRVDGKAFNSTIPFTAPTFDDGQYVLLAMALVDDAGFYYPSDIKTLASGSARQLTYPSSASGPGAVLSVMRRADTSGGPTGAHVDEMSVVFQQANLSSAVDFLPVVSSPELRGSTLVLHPPSAADRVQAVATYAVLSRVTVVESGNVKLEKKAPEWEVFADAWTNSLELPEWPGKMSASATSRRWEVTFLGSQDGVAPSGLGPAVFEKVSHATRAAVDFR